MNKSIKLLAILIILLSIPFTLFISQQRQEIRQKASENNMTVGFNLRGAVHYGKGDLLPYSNASDIDTSFSEIQRMGGKVIRVFAANKHIDDAEAARRLDAFLTKASSYNISVIISLIDFYNSGSYPQGMESSYSENWNGIGLLDLNFFNGGYNGRFKDFIRTVVNQNKNHSNIYAWEVGNELKYDKSPQTFVSFMRDITDTIKSLDPNHSIATGMLNAGHTALKPQDIYPQLPNADIITIHNYNGDRGGEADVLWASSNGKRVIGEELGFDGTDDRTQKYTSEMDYSKNLGLNMVLQWGFLAKQLGDNGDGDRSSGMDAIWHSDYDSLFNIFKSYNCPSGTCEITNPTIPSLEVNNLSADPSNANTKEEISIKVSGKASSIRLYLHDNNPLVATDKSIGAYDPEKVEEKTFYLVGIASSQSGSDDINSTVKVVSPSKAGTYKLVANAISSDGKNICAWDKKVYSVGADGIPLTDGKSCTNTSPATLTIKIPASSRPPKGSINVTGNDARVINGKVGQKFDFQSKGSVSPYTETSIFKGEIYIAKIKNENEKTVEEDYGINCGNVLPTQQKGWCLLRRVENLNTSDSVIDGTWTPQAPGSYWVTGNVFSTGGQCSGNPTVSYPYYPDKTNVPDFYYQPCDRDGDNVNLDLIKIIVDAVSQPPSSPTSTGIHSPSPTPTIQTPTPTFVQGGTQLAFELILQGVGPNGGNQNPKKPTRQLKVQVFDTDNREVANKSGDITFDRGSGSFKGTVDLGVIQTNSNKFVIKVKTKRYLRKLIDGVTTLNLGALNKMPLTTMIVGDINDDNRITIEDYNILIGCFNNKNVSCINKEGADLDDNGIVDGIDLNLFLRSIGFQEGD